MANIPLAEFRTLTIEQLSVLSSTELFSVLRTNCGKSMANHPLPEFRTLTVEQSRVLSSTNCNLVSIQLLSAGLSGPVKSRARLVHRAF
jgi:hypothetical protein